MRISGGQHTSVLSAKKMKHFRGRCRLVPAGGTHAQRTHPDAGRPDGRRTTGPDLAGHPSRTAPQQARRARIIPACADGQPTTGIAGRLHLSPTTVCKWRTRFLADRLDGLTDEPRPGAPRRITDAQVEEVVVRTLESTPPGATHWSTRGDRSTAASTLRVAVIPENFAKENNDESNTKSGGLGAAKST